MGEGSHILPITHLQFANDTILFSTHDESSLDNLLNVIKQCEKASGLNVNCHKSEFMGIGIAPHTLSHLAHRFGCKPRG